MNDLTERLRELPTSNNKLRDEAIAEIKRLTFVEKNHLQGIAMLEAHIAGLEAALKADKVSDIEMLQGHD